MNFTFRIASLLFLCGIFALAPARQAIAHCDGLDGPVVTASREALESGDISRVLIWVPKQDESEVQDLFKKVLAVRSKKDAEASALADTYFFETVIRVHRAGEGASYTGLKPAGRDLGPAIPAADEALEKGSLKELDILLTGAVSAGLKTHFEDALHKRSFKKDDVDAGRKYVEAYVQYIHYVEQLHARALASPKHHYHEAEAE